MEVAAASATVVAGSMRLRGEQGQTGAEMLGMLLLVALVVGALTSSGTATAIASHTGSLICRIAGGECEEPESPPSSDPGGGDEDDEPSGPILTDQPLSVLPFPGSLSVKCTYSETSTTACMPPDQPGVSVQTTGEVSVERSETALMRTAARSRRCRSRASSSCRRTRRPRAPMPAVRSTRTSASPRRSRSRSTPAPPRRSSTGSARRPIRSIRGRSARARASSSRTSTTPASAWRPSTAR